MDTRFSRYKYSRDPSKTGSASSCIMFSTYPNLLKRDLDNRLQPYYQLLPSSMSLNLRNGDDKSEGMSINISRYSADFQGLLVSLHLDKSLFSRECDDQLKTLQPYETIPEAKFLKHFRTGVGRVKRS